MTTASSAKVTRDGVTWIACGGSETERTSQAYTGGLHSVGAPTGSSRTR
jgi:hypothetical protein